MAHPYHKTKALDTCLSPIAWLPVILTTIFGLSRRRSREKRK